MAYGNTKDNGDGSYTCQHGAAECETDVIDSCVEYKLSGDINSIATGDTALEAWPFILCMEQQEGDPTQAESCFEQTMGNSTIASYKTIQDCVTNEAADVQAVAAKATPEHDFVPWCLVNGEVLQHEQLLTQTVCKAYTGPKPAACKALGAPEADLRCYNKQ